MNKARADGGVAILEELAEKGCRFEVAVGRNGRIWVNGESVKTTFLVGNAVVMTDEKGLSVEDQVKLTNKLVKKQ